MRPLTTLSHERLQAMAPGGRRVTESREEIVRYLEDTLSPEHGALFADAVIDPSAGSSQWFTTLEGPIVRYEEADPGTQAEAYGRLQRLRQDIEAEVERLGESRRRGDQLLGRLLAAAVEIPDSSTIFVVGERPVLVGWGYVRDGNEAQHGVIAAMGPPRKTAAPARGAGAAPEPTGPGAAGLAGSQLVEQRGLVERRPVSWATLLLWLMLTLLVVAIMISLLSACGIGLPSRIAGIELANRCPLASLPDRSDEAIAAEAHRTTALERTLARLQIGLQDRIGACSVAVAQAQAAPPAVEEEDFDRRVREQGGTADGQNMITLTWDSSDDLDLALRCPNGQQVWFRNMSACGAQLEVDVNASRIEDAPVEHIIMRGEPPAGRYQVVVKVYQQRENRGAAVPYRVRIVVGGHSQVVEGAVRPTSNGDVVAEFDIP